MKIDLEKIKVGKLKKVGKISFSYFSILYFKKNNIIIS